MKSFKDVQKARLAREAETARRKHWAPFYFLALRRGEHKRRLAERAKQNALITERVEVSQE